jgi:hypothetical protein
VGKLKSKALNIRKFDANWLRDLFYGDCDDAEVVLNEIKGKGRWSTKYRFVFKEDGKFYETSYSVGSTEYQEERPWGYDDTVSCTLVEEFERTVKDYRPIKETTAK